MGLIMDAYFRATVLGSGRSSEAGSSPTLNSRSSPTDRPVHCSGGTSAPKWKNRLLRRSQQLMKPNFGFSRATCSHADSMLSGCDEYLLWRRKPRHRAGGIVTDLEAQVSCS